MKKSSARGSARTYDIVETAIDLSKELRGTWEGLLRKRGARPWAAEVKTPSNRENPASQEQDEVATSSPESQIHP